MSATKELGLYLFQVFLDEEIYCVFAKNAKEAFDKASGEVNEWADVFNVEIKLLCFENDIINLKELK